MVLPSLLTETEDHAPVPGVGVCAVHDRPLSSETYRLPCSSAATILEPVPLLATLLQVWLPLGVPGLTVHVWPCSRRARSVVM